tara:strand:+ start:3863 stop:4297 length:435 start_codon:yes stop_codon:yes gene_type:complete
MVNQLWVSGMKCLDLSFAKVHILRDDIAEVIVNEGVEINKEQVTEYHQALRTNLRSPFSLLINKKFSYTYDFYAQRSIADLQEINAIAVVAYNQLSRMSTESLALIPRRVEWNMTIFASREDALDWLQFEQRQIGSPHSDLSIH